MTRGRRPNLTLEPSRQLQTQRAFRERKAAHLRDLEDTVQRQAEEIATLKERLGEDVEDEAVTTNKRPRAAEVGDGKRRADASSTAPPPCGNCQQLHTRNTDLLRQLAETERQLAYQRQSSGTTSASATTATTSVTSSPSSISSPAGSSKAAFSSSSNNVGVPHRFASPNYTQSARATPAQGRIHWTQPLSPSLQVPYHPAQTYERRVDTSTPYHNRYPDPDYNQQYTRLVPPHNPNAQAAAMYASATPPTSSSPHAPYEQQHHRVATYPPQSTTKCQGKSTCDDNSSRCRPTQPATAVPDTLPDQDKCCLGLFDCDADGRIIV